MMLLWALVVVAVILAVEIAVRLPLVETLKKTIHNGQRAIQVVQASAISDHWKEKVLPAYAMRILRASLLLFVLIVMIFMPFFAVSLIGEWLDVHVMKRLMTVSGIILSMIPAFAWVFLRNKLNRG